MYRKAFMSLFIGIILIPLFMAKGFALTIDPAVVELSVTPGSNAVGEYTVRNDSGNKVIINVEPETYYGNNIKNWLKIKQKTFKLNKGETKKVQYIINTPKDFIDEYAAKIYFKQTPVTKGGKGASIITRMGSSFYVSAKEKEILSPEIINYHINNNHLNLNLSLDIKNNGNVHLRFYYDLTVFSQKGEELYTTDARSPLAVVIPGIKKKVDMPFKIKKGLIPGKYYGVLNLYYGNVMPLTHVIKRLTGFEVK